MSTRIHCSSGLYKYRRHGVDKNDVDASKEQICSFRFRAIGNCRKKSAIGLTLHDLGCRVCFSSCRGTQAIAFLVILTPASILPAAASPLIWLMKRVQAS